MSTTDNRSVAELFTDALNQFSNTGSQRTAAGAQGTFV